MKSERPKEIRVGTFIATALVLVLLAVWKLGSAQNLFSSHEVFFITLPSAAGISPGAKVTISGVKAGVVESFLINAQNQNVQVNLSISKEFEIYLRKDSVAEVITEGLLGDKLIAIAAGSPSSSRLSPGSEILTRQESSLQGLFNRGDRLATDLSKLAKDLDRLVLLIEGQIQGGHLSTSLEKLDTILGKINQGNGVLGGLVNDPKLYDDVKALLGESNENRIVRNIVRNTIKDSEKTKVD
jgi:phospholipid/cholesterol/gamma-HCH transport system substrate-binding protein